MFAPLNPMPSQMRYLRYISMKNVMSEWPPADRALTLDCIILRMVPNFHGQGGFRPIFRIYGPDPLMPTDQTPKVLFSTPKKSNLVRFYSQVIFSDMDAITSHVTTEPVIHQEKQGLGIEEFAKVLDIFNHLDWLDGKKDIVPHTAQLKISTISDDPETFFDTQEELDFDNFSGNIKSSTVIPKVENDLGMPAHSSPVIVQSKSQNYTVLLQSCHHLPRLMFQRPVRHQWNILQVQSYHNNYLHQFILGD
ncbi:hypothetical protein PR202_gb10077 [Eleusine coracana subsp. coracana]|uniref:C2 tensin-type domain-containing protein n=1 Tax=Eleusine coracana subsp. coracana TaxID=191504 RepID=A0AAV5EJG9_ELECO|nr:hypothetical protein PR202_gb10077 [Eleusine coracana subsp. coracana]